MKVLGILQTAALVLLALTAAWIRHRRDRPRGPAQQRDAGL
jgi:hypothetical protein